MARLYSNENFPLPAVEELRKLGHDVVTVQERGKANEAVPDEEILAWAAAEERAVLTLNRRDFIQLHRAATDHAGIIVCSVDNDFARQASRIDEEIQRNPELAGQLLRIERPSQ